MNDRLRSGVRSGVAMAAMMLAAGCASKGASPGTLVIDHKASTAQLNGEEVEDGDRIRVSKRLPIRVINTNSAIYSCAAKTEDLAVPEIEAAKGFVSGLSGYLAEFAALPAITGQLDTAAVLRDTANLAAWNVRGALAKIDSLLVGPGGLRTASALTLATLDSMRAVTPVDPSVVGRYRSSIADLCSDPEKCPKLKATAGLATALANLSQATARYWVRLAGKPVPTTAEQRLLRVAGEVLADADGLMGFAYGTERLVAKTYGAKPEIVCSDTVSVSLAKGKTAAITVTPSAIPGLQRTSTLPPYETTIEVQPDWIVRPTLGVAFLYAPKSEFAKFGTKERPDGSYDVREAGSVDGRFTYGLTLSTTWRGLDQRDKHNFAIYLPELTVNPNDLKAIGLGAGLSFYKFKLGAGRLWTKHDVLAEGQTVGTVLLDPEELATKSTYGRSKFYLSLAIVGIAPFVP